MFWVFKKNVQFVASVENAGLKEYPNTKTINFDDQGIHSKVILKDNYCVYEHYEEKENEEKFGCYLILADNICLKLYYQSWKMGINRSDYWHNVYVHQQSYWNWRN